MIDFKEKDYVVLTYIKDNELQVGVAHKESIIDKNLIEDTILARNYKDIKKQKNDTFDVLLKNDIKNIYYKSLDEFILEYPEYFI